VIDLLSDDCTIPFVARYRKKTTAVLDEVQIEAIEDALAPTRKLIDRKNRVWIRIRRALQPGDLIAIWLTKESPVLEKHITEVGFAARSETLRSGKRVGKWHQALPSTRG
jgi:hypothetical protein